MKIQMKILLFVVCLNLAFWLVRTLTLPGASDVQAQLAVDADEYEAHFNATDLAGRWTGPTIITGIPVIGDIFSGLFFVLQNILYLVDGFPQFLDHINYTYINDAGGQIAFIAMSTAFRAVFAILMTVMVIEFISGRYFTT